MSANFLATGEDLDLTALSVSSLAHQCRKSTNLFFKGLEVDDRPCFELFRRAVKQQNEASWDILLEQYYPLVVSWVQRHPYFPNADEEIDYFVNRTFDKFWHAFNRNPQKLNKFKNLKAVLSYLKLCTNSALKEYVERQMQPQGISLSQRPIDTLPNENNPIQQVDDNISANHLWRYIMSLTKNPEEKIVAEETFLYDLKPREIQSRHSDIFSTVSQVSRVKENLMARLRRDKEISRIFSPGD